MTSILYIGMNIADDIPELYLYQIYLKVYKESSSDDKEVAIFNVYEKDKENFTFSKIIRESKSGEDKLVIEKKEIIIDENTTIEKEIDNYINELQKDYKIYILLSNLGQARLLGKYITKMITIKKGDYVYPM